MLISTNTASCMTSRGRDTLLGDVAALKKLYAAGFRAADLSFVFVGKPDFILAADDWQKHIEEVGLAAEKLGMVLNQCHFPFFEMRRPEFRQNGYAELFDEMTRRAIVAAGMLKIHHGVLHPQDWPDLNHERKACLERNHQVLDGYVEMAMQNGVAVAIENMPPTLDGSSPMRYGMHYEEVIELVDSYQEPEWVGICWDVGHANLARFDQTRALNAIGDRLIALHLHDNSGKMSDDHLIPYLGNIDWETLMTALVDIHYQGDLTYETGRFGKFAAMGQAQDSMMRATYESACAMMALYDQIKASKNETAR